MTFTKHITLAATAIIGLMFLGGTGCGQSKDQGKDVMLQVYQRDLARSEARTACLAGIPTTGISSEEAANRRTACFAAN